jgi:hypothetical protein
MLPSESEHRCLLLRQGLVRLHRLDSFRWQGSGPRLFAQPAIIRPPRYPQSHKRLLRRPTAALPGLRDLLMHALLQLRRQLAVIL